MLDIYINLVEIVIYRGLIVVRDRVRPLMNYKYCVCVCVRVLINKKENFFFLSHYKLVRNNK